MALPTPSPDIQPPRAPQAPPPEPDRALPYLPPGPEPLLFEEFAGINTQVPRAGVPDQQMAWCDGWMPIAKRNLRTLYGVGTPIYVTSGALSIRFFGFYILNSVEYAAVFLNDGSIVQVNTETGAVTQIAPAGTITNAIVTNVGFTDYNETYLIVVANQTDGYWLWDGGLFYAAGGLSPIVTLTNVGSSYVSVPTVLATGGSGHGATFQASIANGIVTNVVVANPGTGYLPGQTITLAFSGGLGAGGSGASLTAVISNAGTGSGATFKVIFAEGSNQETAIIQSVTINNGGSGYSQFTTLAFTVGVTSPPIRVVTAAVLQPVITGGVITGVTVVNGGAYQAAQGMSWTTVTGTITATDNGAYTVTSVTINNGGSGYSQSTTAICSGGGAPVQQATLQLTIVGGVITIVTVASGGLYGSNTPPTVTVADAPAPAAGTVQLMPFGVNGTAVETYSGHVVVTNGTEVNGSAPGSPTDFATSDGGFSFTANNSYTALVNTNGFLYMIGESATDYISGVTATTVSMVTTTQYTFLNADPEVGTPYPASVLTFGNYIILGNSVGVHFLAGSTFTKISDELDGSGLLDGLWGSIPNFGGNQLSASKATIFNKKVWMILATVIDPITGLQANKLFLTDTKKWWSSQQDVTLTFVASSEFNSVLIAYGTNGTGIYPLFQQPTTGFTKTVQSRLWDAPGGYTHEKASVRLFGLAQFTIPASISITVDNETTESAGPYVASAQTVVWTNASGQVMNWTTAGSLPMTWSIQGYAVFPPQAVGQAGVLTGLTATTTGADVTLLSLALQDEIVGYRG